MELIQIVFDSKQEMFNAFGQDPFTDKRKLTGEEFWIRRLFSSPLRQDLDKSLVPLSHFREKCAPFTRCSCEWEQSVGR